MGWPRMRFHVCEVPGEVQWLVHVIRARVHSRGSTVRPRAVTDARLQEILAQALKHFKDSVERLVGTLDKLIGRMDERGFQHNVEKLRAANDRNGLTKPLENVSQLRNDVVVDPSCISGHRKTWSREAASPRRIRRLGQDGAWPKAATCSVRTMIGTRAITRAAMTLSRRARGVCLLLA